MMGTALMYAVLMLRNLAPREQVAEMIRRAEVLFPLGTLPNCSLSFMEHVQVRNACVTPTCLLGRCPRRAFVPLLLSALIGLLTLFIYTRFSS